MDAIRKDSEKFDAELWAELYTLRAAVKGPEGYTSWQDAAVDERMKRHAAERTLASKEAELAEAGLKYVSLFGELQNAMEEIAKMKEALFGDNGALTRMDRARGWLTDGNPRPECNYGVLDTSDLRAALTQPTE